MRLGSDGSDVRMDAEELQQRPGAAFLHADDDRLRKLLGPEGVGHGDAAVLRAARRRRRGRAGVEETRRRPQLVQDAAAILQDAVIQSPLGEQRARDGVRERGEAVDEVGGDQEHGEEQRGFGERLAEVEPDSASATSHELFSCAVPKGQNEGSMLLPPSPLIPALSRSSLIESHNLLRKSQESGGGMAASSEETRRPFCHFPDRTCQVAPKLCSINTELAARCP